MGNARKRKSQTILGCLLAYYVFFNMPAVRYYVSTYVSMLLLLLLFIGVWGYSFRYKGTTGVFFLVSLLYLVLIIADELVEDEQLLISIWNVFLKYMPLVLGCLLIRNRMDQLIRMAVVLTILTYIVTCITTYFGLLSYPMASRDLASAQEEVAEFYSKMNVGGFEFIYSLVIVHPLFVYALRKRRKTLGAILVTIGLTICIIASQYTLALVTFVLSMVAYVFPVQTSHKGRVNIWVKIAIIVLGAFLIAPELLTVLAKEEAFKAYADKLLDVKRMLQGKDPEMSNTSLRLNLYRTSLETFFRYPVFGGEVMGDAVYGGHSFFLDTMAQWGMAGITIVIALIVTLEKWYHEMFARSTGYYYIQLSLVLALILACINPVFFTHEIGFVVPIFAYSLRRLEENNYYDRQIS